MEKKKIKNYLVYTAATAVFIVIVYMIFSSSEENPDSKAAMQANLNKDLPEGEVHLLPDNKVTAYEDLAQSEEMRLRGFGANEFSVDLSQLNEDSASQHQPVDVDDEERDKVSASLADALKAIKALEKSRTAAPKTSETPASDEQERRQEAERRSRQLDELRIKNENTQKMLLEMLQSQQQQQGKEMLAAVNRSGDNAVDAKALTDNVSAVPDSYGDVATTLGRSSGRTGGFYGMGSAPVQRNSIRACAYGKQEVGDGQHLRIRLLEPMMVSGQLVAAGSILTGACRITTDRLQVSVHSVECGGVITRVALEVYDNDGQQGLYVPGSMELEAGREIGSDIASSVGSTASSQTSMFSQQSAAEQIKADVGRGVVQGTFRFIGRKLQVVKVTVQDKHLLFLMSQK
jgi:conjugative transposon TraM protein